MRKKAKQNVISVIDVGGLRKIIKFLNCNVPILNQNLDYVRILPIGDAHIGDPSFQESKLKEELYSCRYEPTILILTGDILNNALRSSVSNCYKEVIPAGDEQINYALNIFGEYKKHIGLIVPGNHEYRTDKEVNVDLAKIYAERLGAPYLSPHGLLKVQFGKNAKGDPINYVLYVHHGSGGGKARSGKTKAMLDQEWMVSGADVYFRSHTHVIEAFSTEVVGFDIRHLTTSSKTIYHVSTGTWLDTSDYAERKELPILPVGCPKVTLSGKERKITITV